MAPPQKAQVWIINALIFLKANLTILTIYRLLLVRGKKSYISKGLIIIFKLGVRILNSF